jgi:hypothetical protein
MMKNLEVLEITGASLVGQLPSEWADASALKIVAVDALSRAHQARSHAESVVRLLSSAAGGVTLNVSSLDLRSTHVRHTKVRGQAVHLAMLRADGATRAETAIQNVVKELNASGASFGLMNLRVLRLADHDLSGELPNAFSQMLQLRVLDVSRRPGVGKTIQAGLTGQLPPSYAALDNLEVSV